MATKKSILTKDKVISMYMQSTLENNEKPKSAYHFAKENGFSESELYNFFGGIDGIEKEVFNQFLIKTLELLEKDNELQALRLQEIEHNRQMHWLWTALFAATSLILSLLLLRQWRRRRAAQRSAAA